MKKEISLNDSKYFELSIGKRILKRDVFQSTGKLPIYSANVLKPFGFLKEPNESISDFEHNHVLWGIDGNFEFNIMPKGVKFAITDHCGAIKILDDTIVPEYLVYQLELKKHEYGFDRTLRASLENMRNVTLNIPITLNGELSREKQEVLVKKYGFIKEMWQDIQASLEELCVATVEFQSEDDVLLKSTMEVAIGDRKYFKLLRGMRVTKKDCVTHRGNIPVVSGRRNKHSYLGYISEDWLKKRKISIYDEPMLVIAANGSVGTIFLRDEPKYMIHDDAIGIKIIDERLNPKYVQYALRESVIRAQFYYNAKLYKKTLSSLKIHIPVRNDGSIDEDKQNELAKKFSMVDALKGSLYELANELEEKFLIVMN